MYNGKHTSSTPPDGKKHRRNSASPSWGGMGKRKLGLILALMLLLTAVGGGTLAWLQAKSKTLQNRMVAGTTPIVINETFDGTAKRDVTITNHGNVPAYIRVTVTSNAVDNNGNPVPGTAPSFTVNGHWTQLGAYWYYNGVVQPGDSTAELFFGPVTVSGGRVDITAQSIQALGGLNAEGDAAAVAWGAYFNGEAWSAA